MTLALMCAATAGAWAQDNATWSGWVGEQLPEEGGKYYLYNESGKAFFLGANKWGTQFSLGQPGYEVTLEKLNDGTYSIKTYEKEGEETRYAKDGYVDGTNTQKRSFVFSTSSSEETSYKCSIKDNGNGSYIYYGNSGTALTYNAGNSDPQWLLVSKKQRVESLGYATAENEMDATFYLAGAGFDRFQANNWNVSGNIETCFPNGAEKNYYYYAQAKNNSNGFDMYQELTGLKNGVYTVSCQGFYRPGANVDANGTQNAVLYANTASRPLPLLADDGNGIPGEGNDTGKAFNDGRFNNVGNITIVVTDGTLRVGVKAETGIADDWCAVDNFRLTYYGESTKSQEQLAFESALNELNGLITTFTGLGANAVAYDLQTAYDQYQNTDSNWGTARDAVRAVIATANNAEGAITSLKNSISTGNTYYENIKEVSATYLLDSFKNAIATTLTEANKTLAEATLENAATVCATQATALDNAVLAAKTWFGLPYTLQKAKDLAEKIGGLANTDEYKAVVADMTYQELTFAKVMEDVAALNAKCRAAMTPDFLKTASTEAPIDMTSFITNPNIYQDKTNEWKSDKETGMPSGWTMAERGSRDNYNPTTDAYCDSELKCFHHGNNQAENNIGYANYYTKINNLPDGRYILKAATFLTRDTEPVHVTLFASLDNVNFKTAVFRRNKENGKNKATLYDNVAGINDGTNTEVEVTVSGGVLYIGIKGLNQIVGGSDQSWYADNFRLYYVGAPEALDLTIDDAGYATCYTPNAITVPEGMTAGIVSAVNSTDNNLTIDWCYTEGTTVPALTGVMLKGDAKTYPCAFSTEAVSKPKKNYLNGTLEDATIDAAGFKYYKLANDAESGLGFYYAKQDGTSIANKAGKAYLALPVETAAGANVLKWDLDATGIENATADCEEMTVDVYTLSGVCVRSNVKAANALQGLHKGVYIVNGKKLVIK